MILHLNNSQYFSYYYTAMIIYDILFPKLFFRSCLAEPFSFDPDAVTSALDRLLGEFDFLLILKGKLNVNCVFFVCLFYKCLLRCTYVNMIFLTSTAMTGLHLCI